MVGRRRRRYSHADVPRGVAILGSTGSIGRSTLQVIEHLGGSHRVVALSGQRQIPLLVEQARAHRPEVIAVPDAAAGAAARDALGRDAPRIVLGAEGLCEIAALASADIVVVAVVGAAGLLPVLSAASAGKTIALANKESLVVGGALVMAEARRRGATILPIDSEHSALFQAMAGGRADEVRRCILTASGGPFRAIPPEALERVSVSEALRHPTWTMGTRVTIDSATLANKGLELIEACWLFDLSEERVDVVVHPESVVHSMVEFVDGSTLAQLSPPDMRMPIQHALTWPRRREGSSPRLALDRAFALRFEPPDTKRFPALALAREAARQRGTLGAAFNAADEVAVDAFVAGRLRFTGIARVIEATMARHRICREPALGDLLDADETARRVAGEVAATLSE